MDLELMLLFRIILMQIFQEKCCQQSIHFNVSLWKTIHGYAKTFSDVATNGDDATVEISFVKYLRGNVTFAGAILRAVSNT